MNIKLKFQPGDRVMFIEDGEVNKGVISNIYHYDTGDIIATVNIGGELIKKRVRDLCKLQDETNEEPSKEPMPDTLSDEVTITRGEFRDKVSKALKNEDIITVCKSIELLSSLCASIEIGVFGYPNEDNE